MVDWSKKASVIKGQFAEQIIIKYLEKEGYVVYAPITDKAHAFDNLAIKDKKTVIIAETKAKSRRTFYPDTGIDLRHYREYLYLQDKHRIHVFIFFVDEALELIYGNFLKKLIFPCEINQRGRWIKYPIEQKGIIFFPLKNMITVGKLNEKEVEFLKNNSTRNYEYPQIKQIVSVKVEQLEMFDSFCYNTNSNTGGS